MLNLEFNQFRELLDELCATWDRPPAKDELVRAYWDALKDVRFSEVRANATRILRTATKDTRFPKPAELRNTAPIEKSATAQAAQTEAERRCIRNWGEFAKRDLQLHNIELGIAQCGRILAADDMSSPQYAEALRQDRQLRDQRMKLLEERARK
jgi:hypothetical protein